MMTETEKSKSENRLFHSLLDLLDDRPNLSRISGEPTVKNPEYELICDLLTCVTPKPENRSELGKNDMIGFSRFTVPIETLVVQTEGLHHEGLKEKVAHTFGFRTFAGLTLAHTVIPAIEEARDYTIQASRQARFEVNLAETDFDTAVKINDKGMKNDCANLIAKRESDIAVWDETRRTLGKVGTSLAAFAKNDNVFSHQLDSAARTLVKYQPQDGDYTPPATAVFKALGSFVNTHSPYKPSEAYAQFATRLHALTGEGKSVSLPEKEAEVVLPRAALPKPATVLTGVLGAKPIPVVSIQNRL